MKKLTALLALLILTTTVSLAQNRPLTGIVRDEKGEPVPFANVKIDGTKTAVQADANGKFEIKAANTARLTISAAGFTTTTVDAAGAAVVTLSPSASTQMSEVVVTTALGIRRPAKSIGYATAKITNTELTQAKAVNLQQGLAGKVSGLNITTTSSSVFEETKINLRGIRSLTGNNQPLLVIDGIPTPITYISSLNPNDVTDVTVLKGASSAAIYGPDGVNGVILITTKKGTSAKPMVTVGSSYQVNRVNFMPKRQNSFGSGSSVDAYGNALYDPLENFSYGPAFDGVMRPVGQPLEDGSIQMLPYAATRDDEQKKFWNSNGSVFQNDISFSAQDFYFSVQDAQVKGLMPKDENRRTAFRFNAGKSYNKFRTNYNINYVLSNSDVVDEQGLSRRFPAYNGGIYNLVLEAARQIPLNNYKDWRNDKYSQYSNYYNEYAANPFWAIDNHRLKSRNEDMLASLELKYDVAPWLQATLRLGANVNVFSSKATRAAIKVSDFARTHRSNVTYNNYPGSVADASSSSNQLTGEFFLTGKKEIRDFVVNYLAGSQVRQNQSKFINTAGNNLVVPGVYNLSNRTGEPGATETNFKTRLASLFGSVGVSYKGWANVEVVGRNDWDSRLNPDANSYFYPGVNASVVLSDAIPALHNASWLSYVKLRGSVSKSGNVNIGAYSLQATYSPINGFPYGALPGFSANNTLPDADIQPEFVNSKELGLELGFLKNRINIDATYFYQRNTDQILTIQQSVTTGYLQRLGNTANFNNYGMEVDLRLTPLINIGKARIDFKMNLTYNDNEITRLSDGVNELQIGGTTNFISIKADSPTAANFAIVGHPAFTFKLSDYERDPQGRVIVNATTGMPTIATNLVVRGRTLPLWILGFNPTFSWKGLNVGMTWDYKGGHNAYHGLGTDMDGYGISARSAQFNRERFVFPNSVYWDGSKYVENTNLTTSGGGINFWGQSVNTKVATNYFTSAAAWRLRELAISYDLPSKWLGNGKAIKRATVSAIGRNILILVPKSNQWSDPEFNTTPGSANPNTFGLSSSFINPPTRIYGGSLTLTF